ncbi:MAG: tetratricopeptide repeat protein [bacterium]
MTQEDHSRELEDLLGKAKALHADGKTREAVELLDSTDSFQHSAGLWALSAHFHYLLEEFQIAESTAKRALEFNPHNRLALHTLGEIEAKAGRYPEAETWFKESIATNPRSSHPYLRLASIYLSQRLYAEAIDILNNGLEKFAGHPQLLERLEYALTMDGRIQEAKRIGKIRRKDKPQDTADMRALVNRFEGMSIDQAIKNLKRMASMEHYKDEPVLHEQLARYLMQKERCAEAIPHLKTLLRLKPRNDYARLNLAYCLFKTGTVDPAWDILTTMESYKNDAHFNLVKIEGFIADNRLGEALNLCIDQLRLYPRDKRFRKVLQVLKRKGVRPQQSDHEETD